MMCRRPYNFGNLCLAIGIGLLISMVIPRCFTVVCIGFVLMAIGCFMVR